MVWCVYLASSLLLPTVDIIDQTQRETAGSGRASETQSLTGVTGEQDHHDVHTDLTLTHDWLPSRAGHSVRNLQVHLQV